MEWRVVLVGDPLQFSAVGRGGMFQHLIEHAPDGAAIEHLDRVHRFEAEWEASASLRLRRGDVTALDDYDEHDRIKSAATASGGRRQLIDRWWELRQDSNDVVMFAATNESATALNLAAQRRLLAAGEVVQPSHQATIVDGSRALVGDEVQTRRNDRSLVTDMGVTVKNRQRWTVEDVGPDGTVAVSDPDRGRVTLPANYAASALTLAYASTAMAGQGRTVDHSLVLVDGPIDVAGLYVPMTRGRLGNEVWVVADPTSPTDAVVLLAEALQRRWADEPAIDHVPTEPSLDAGIGLD